MAQCGYKNGYRLEARRGALNKHPIEDWLLFDVSLYDCCGSRSLTNKCYNSADSSFSITHTKKCMRRFRLATKSKLNGLYIELNARQPRLVLEWVTSKEEWALKIRIPPSV